MTRALPLLLLLLAACTAQPSAPDTGSPGLTGQGRMGAPRGVSSAPDLPPGRRSDGPARRTTPSPAVVNVTTSEGDPSPTTSTPGTKSRTGWATWFDDGAGYYGAVRSWRYGDDPYAVQVCLAARPGTCTHVVVRDYCACGSRHGEATVIDLSPSAFRELAPLSRGVIRVTVTGPIPIPLPPTDEED